KILRKPRSNPTRVDERAIDPISGLQRAEVGATSVWLGEADDHEVASLFRLDLYPVTRASTAILRGRFLGDDSLQSERHHLREESLALAFYVVEIAHRAERGHRVFEKLLAARQRQRPHIEIFVRYQVERIECRRQLDRRSANLH